MGWLRDLPDFRDFTVETNTFTAGQKNDIVARGRTVDKAVSIKKAFAKAETTSPPGSVDLRPWCSPIEDQLTLGSCTAQAAVGILEYFEKRAFGTWIDASRLFVYKTARNLLGWRGDTGAYPRTTMASLVLFGAPPEKYWPYTDNWDPGPARDKRTFDDEPWAFDYALAQNFQCLSYFRYDVAGVTPANLLANIKAKLNQGWASMFGFSVYQSMFTQAKTTGKIPFPASDSAADPRVGGHAVCAVGYDDTITIQNSIPGSPITTGALLIRNSWGTAWGGMGGYLWMPYDYVLKGLTADWWTLYNAEWINTGQFNL
jgi:C1A family cysteine protease